MCSSSFQISLAWKNEIKGDAGVPTRFSDRILILDYAFRYFYVIVNYIGSLFFFKATCFALCFEGHWKSCVGLKMSLI